MPLGIRSGLAELLSVFLMILIYSLKFKKKKKPFPNLKVGYSAYSQGPMIFPVAPSPGTEGRM